MGDNDDDEISCKGRTVDGSTMKRKRGARMDALVNCGLLDEEKAQVDLILLRPLPGQIPSLIAQLRGIYNSKRLAQYGKGLPPQSVRNQRLTIGVSDLEFETLLIFYEVTGYSRRRNT